jgi:replication factor C small subunit
VENTDINEIISNIKNRANSLWVEKYRPKTLDELVLEDSQHEIIKNIIEKKDVPHLILYGKPGTGKNSIVNVILNELKFPKLIINASEERGIDTIRDKILTFASTGGFRNAQKIIVLNEADGLSYIAQGALKEVLEVHSAKSRFILTCNEFHKISEPIRSRCIPLCLTPSPKGAAKRLLEIIKNENFEEVDQKALVELVKDQAKKGYIDIRSLIFELQRLYITYKKLTLDVITTKKSGDFKIIENSLLMAKNKDVKKLSQYLKDQNLGDEIFNILKEYLLETNNNTGIIVLSDYVYKSKLVYDLDLIILACFLDLAEL